MCKQEYDIEEFEEQQKKIVYEKVANNLCLNVEYSIIIMVLKYLNTEQLSKNRGFTGKMKNFSSVIELYVCLQTATVRFERKRVCK